MGRSRREKPIFFDPDENWKSKDPKALAYEIATFMGGEWPTRPVRKIQISLEGVPQDDEELFATTKLNPTLLSEMTVKTRFLFLEVYLDDIQDVYSEVMETLTKIDGRDLCDPSPSPPRSAHVGTLTAKRPSSCALPPASWLPMLTTV